MQGSFRDIVSDYLASLRETMLDKPETNDESDGTDGSGENSDTQEDHEDNEDSEDSEDSEDEEDNEDEEESEYNEDEEYEEDSEDNEDEDEDDDEDSEDNEDDEDQPDEFANEEHNPLDDSSSSNDDVLTKQSDENSDDAQDDPEDEEDEYEEDEEEEQEENETTETALESASIRTDSTDSYTATVPLDTPTLYHLHSEAPYYHVPSFQQNMTLEPGQTVTFSMFVYVLCNNTYCDPYIACMMAYDESLKAYRFPQIVYEAAVDVEHDKDLRSKCFELLYPLLNVTPETIDEDIIERTQRSFQGFLYKTDAKHGCIGIDVGEFIPFLNKTSTASTLSEYFHNTLHPKDEIPLYSWAIMDEIMDRKAIYNVPVDPKATEWIKENPAAYTLIDEAHRETQLPKMLFSAEQSASRSYDQDHGRLYLFTQKVPEDTFKTPRYVVYPIIHTEQENNSQYGVFSRGNFRKF
jgi:hypothetical protein